MKPVTSPNAERIIYKYIKKQPRIKDASIRDCLRNTTFKLGMHGVRRVSKNQEILDLALRMNLDRFLVC